MIRFSILVCPVIILLSGCENEKTKSPPEEEYHAVKVMTYNVLFSTSDDPTLEVLKETGADIIGLQEASAARLATMAQGLQYFYHSFPKTPANLGNGDTGILSRFPITRYFQNGVVIRINPDLEVAVFTVHLLPYPYEPYDFRDGIISTPEEAVSSASLNRFPGFQPVLDEIADALSEGYPVFLTGDFNEPSWLDWTAETAEKHMHFGKEVEWPVSKSITLAGLIDAYRANFPGNTWTTFQAEDEVYDRIDIIYHTATSGMTLTDIRTVGGPDDAAGITVAGYPSDHYGLVATYLLEN